MLAYWWARLLPQVLADGRLPGEMGRGARACTYHTVASEALVYLAHLSNANGVSLHTRSNSALLKTMLINVR